MYIYGFYPLHFGESPEFRATFHKVNVEVRGEYEIGEHSPRCALHMPREVDKRHVEELTILLRLEHQFAQLFDERLLVLKETS